MPKYHPVMPKVLRIINRLNLGGPTYNASYLSKYLQGGYETLLLSGMIDDSEASSAFIAEEMGLQPRYIPNMHRSINPLKDRKALKSIKSVIREYKPDIVHTHAAKAGALGRLAAIQCKVPVIVHTFHGHVFHSYFNPIKTRVFLGIERYLGKRTTRIIAISNLQKQELSETFKVAPPEKFSVIPLGFDLKRFQEDVDVKRKAFREKYNLDDHEIAIGIIGRLVPVKNHRLFLEVVQSLADEMQKPFRAFIIGDGEERQHIEQMAVDMQIPFAKERFEAEKKLLTFTSWIKDIDYAYAGLDIVALTSLNEGTPVSLIEAQAAEKPIISTAVGGIEDVVKIGETALLSPSNDVKGMRDNLKKLLNNEGMRNQMGQNAFAYTNEKFHYMRLVKDIQHLYDTLLENPWSKV